MKINLKKVITIMVCVVVLEVVYLIGFYTPNKVAYGNSEIEISAENPTQNLESDLNFENEFLEIPYCKLFRQRGKVLFG